MKAGPAARYRGLLESMNSGALANVPGYAAGGYVQPLGTAASVGTAAPATIDYARLSEAVRGGVTIPIGTIVAADPVAATRALASEVSWLMTGVAP